MNKLLFLALLLLAGAALAQTPAPAPATPPQDAMEPGVNTSAPGRASRPRTPDGPGVNTSAAAAGEARRDRNYTKPVPRSPRAANKGNAKDRLDLESTQITGNRELPKVLYIVPWRSAEMGDLVGRPVNSLLDEVLEPVDRDVFRRQNRYFEALQPNEAAPASNPGK